MFYTLADLIVKIRYDNFIVKVDVRREIYRINRVTHLYLYVTGDGMELWVDDAVM